MDDEAIELMAAAGTYLVADIYCGDYIAEVGRAQGWGADVLRKNDETTVTPARGLREVRAGGRADRLRHRQRHLPARAGTPASSRTT